MSDVKKIFIVGSDKSKLLELNDRLKDVVGEAYESVIKEVNDSVIELGYDYPDLLIFNEEHHEAFFLKQILNSAKRKYPEVPMVLLKKYDTEKQEASYFNDSVMIIPNDELNRIKPIYNKLKGENDTLQEKSEIEIIGDKLDIAEEGGKLGVWEWDVQANKLAFNKRLAQIMMFSHDELAKQLVLVPNKLSFWDNVLHPHDIQNASNALKRHLNGETPVYSVIYRVLTQDADWKWVQDHGKVVEFDGFGNPKLLYGVIIDIDQQLKTEDSLIETNRRYTSLIGSLPGVVFRWGLDKNKPVEYISDRCKDLTGFYGREFYAGESPLSWGSLINVSDIERIWHDVQIAVANKRQYEITYPIKTKMGEERWVIEQGSPVFSEDGQAVAFEGFLYDVTDRKKAQEKIISTILETEDKERKRIAKEIHDSLGQNLTSALMSFEGIAKDLAQLSDKGKLCFEKGLDFLNNAINESRGIAHNLMPKSIEDFGYIPTVESMLEGLRMASTVSFSFYSNFDSRLDQAVEMNLYRITQEAINNILKHANPSEVSIQLIQHEDELILTIEDDGDGFEIKDVNSHFGLNSMRNRAQSMAAIFSLDSKPKRGTSIMISVPIKKDK